MKKFVIAAITLLSATTAFCQTQEEEAQIKTLSEKVLQIENSLNAMEPVDSTIRDLKSTMNSNTSLIDSVQKSLESVRKQQNLINREVESLKAGQANLGEQVISNASEFKQTSDNLSARITTAQDEAKTEFAGTRSRLKSQWILGSISALLLLAIAILSHLLLRKNIKSSAVTIYEVKKAQEKLQQESLGLDEKLMEVLNKRITIEKEQTSSASKPDHSLALKVADEIVRIETNLSRMDSSVKGYKQLSASLRRIKDNFAANGYEIVDMLGKPYTEGLKATANFVSDDTLDEGTQIITGIIKPQINYNGAMIQAAQITVSQN